MAGRILNRRELRKQSDQADQVGQPDTAAPGATPVAAPPAKKARKAPATPRPKKVRKPKEQPRLRCRWGVFDGGMKQVAVFDYNQRIAADEKVVELNTKKKGGFFLQMVKEPMPEPVVPEAVG